MTVTGPNEQTYTTQVGVGLDPEWEEETFFKVGRGRRDWDRIGGHASFNFTTRTDPRV